jgi:hypothetical protein
MVPANAIINYIYPWVITTNNGVAKIKKNPIHYQLPQGNYKLPSRSIELT